MGVKAEGFSDVGSCQWHKVYEGKGTTYCVPNLLRGTQYCFRLKYSSFLTGESPWGCLITRTRGILLSRPAKHPPIMSNVELQLHRKKEKKRQKRARQKARQNAK